uniref:Uncharacterized protein n=1 Tax=Panagrolaimus sp. JU765 TaxID=591449 RepID=A0AC34QYN3_9BILA
MFHQNEPDADVDPKFLRCCGRIHVRKLASIIAFLRCCGRIHVRKLVSIIAVIQFVLLIPCSYNVGGFSKFIAIAFGAIVFALVLLADKEEKPQYYVPYLLYMGLGIILVPIAMAVVVALMFTSPETLGPDFDKHKNAVVLIMVIFVIIGAIFEAIHMYCWLIVYGARRSMLQVNSEQTAPLSDSQA